MSGVTINACLLLALTNTSDWVSLLFASLGSWGSETPWCTTIRKRPHLQRKSELRLAGHSAQTLLSVVWNSVFYSTRWRETSLIWNTLLHRHNAYTYREGILMSFETLKSFDWIYVWYFAAESSWPQEDSSLVPLFHCRTMLCCKSVSHFTLYLVHVVRFE